MFDLSFLLLAQETPGGFVDGVKHFLEFVPRHWNFCLLHFLQFAVWGAWYVVLGNMLNARGFKGTEIGRIYATIPLGSIISPMIVGPIADKYINQEILIGGLHLSGAVFLFLMAKTAKPRPFFWIALVYAVLFAPTLSLVNSIVFAHDADIFGGNAGEGFPWIRVFGTIGWIIAGLSHALILKKGEPMNERPLLLACGLSAILGLYAFTLPVTKPAAVLAAEAAAASGEAADVAAEEIGAIAGAKTMITSYPVFFGVSFATAMAMGLYFAFAALYLEKRGIGSNVVGPVMTIGQWIEIFFMLTLPAFLGKDNANMNHVLLVGVAAWALRFGLFAIGRPLPLILLGVAIHGICFDFFFAAGMINTAAIAPAQLTATAQQVYGFLVYGLGMYLGSELSGWLHQYFTKPVPATAAEPSTAEEAATNWRGFWIVPCLIIAICAALFAANATDATSATDEAGTGSDGAAVTDPVE
ncbi:MAG: MFS transporter [Planctomycetaceae bacterium]